MPTRQTKPSLLRGLAVTATLVAVQIYLGWSAFGGKFGIESRQQMQQNLQELALVEAQTDAELARMREQIALLDRNRLDPDLLTERARALLGMAHPDDLIVPLAGPR